MKKFAWFDSMSDTELDKVSSRGIGNRAIGRVIGRTSRAASQSALSERLIKRSSSTVSSEEADLTSTEDSFDGNQIADVT